MARLRFTYPYTIAARVIAEIEGRADVVADGGGEPMVEDIRLWAGYEDGEDVWVPTDSVLDPLVRDWLYRRKGPELYEAAREDMAQKSAHWRCVLRAAE